MGIVSPFAEIIVMEAKRKPFSGSVATLGRQTVHLTHDSYRKLILKYNLENYGAEPSVSYQNRPSLEQAKLITDINFFNGLGVRSLDAIDISDYEGANIIFDMNNKYVPDHLHRKYNVIINGSCLDNIFDPHQAIQNTTSMLSPNGRIIHMEHSSYFNGPYLMFSPEWLVDYYVMNGFNILGVFVGVFDCSERLYNGPWAVFSLSELGLLSQNFSMPSTDSVNFLNSEGKRIATEKHRMTMVIAEKARNNGLDSACVPVQALYRSQRDREQYQSAVLNMKERGHLGESQKIWDCIGALGEF